MSRRKKLINHTNIPQHEIETIARCLMPDILAYYHSEEGQQAFAKWQAEQGTNPKKIQSTKHKHK